MTIKLVTQKVSGARIKVVGIGGGGGNALNSMVDKGIEGVEFIAINTDAQALERSKAHVKIQVGKSLTNGLGAGMNDDIAFRAVEENRDDIERALIGSDMVFITAGMGGGTGTGAAPPISRIAKTVNALVVAIVTKPFNFEGKPRLKLAEQGLEKLKNEVDSLIVIPNQKIIELINTDTTKREAFELADRVLYNATKGISQIITKTGEINVDFADVKTIMKDMGDAMIGTGIATGDDRATRAASDAITNPLLEGLDIKGSKCVLTNICSNGEIKFSEIERINEIIQNAAGEEAKYIFGLVDDENMKDSVMVTVIATGFTGDMEESFLEEEAEFQKPVRRIQRVVSTGKITKIPTSEDLAGLDIPSWKRREVKLDDDLNEDNITSAKEAADEIIFDDLNLDDDYSKPAFLRRSLD
jgi:cell division protein FtsZ